MEEPFCDVPSGTRLIETMLWQPGQGVALAQRHRGRLRVSAGRLGFVFDPEAFDASLAAVAGAAPLRLRLTLDAKGRIEMTSATAPEPAAFWRVAIAPVRLISNNPWLRVKSTRRQFYDDARAALPDKLDEAIFLNEHGHVCEGTITNLIVEIAGQWLTPPLSDGLLPGVMRAELLASGVVRESTITVGDLSHATRFRLCNALRGQIEASLVEWPQLTPSAPDPD